MKRLLPVIVVLGLLAGCGGGGGSTQTTKAKQTMLIAVNAPFSVQSARGEAIAKGVELAAAQINQSGGIYAGGTLYDVRVKRYDDALSARTAVANVRHAIDDGAVAIVDEGTGVDSSWQRASSAHVPIFIVFEGATELVNPKTRPNVFRIAPDDHGISFRFAEYLAHKHLRLAVLHDDSEYGVAGASAIDNAFSYDKRAIVSRVEVGPARRTWRRRFSGSAIRAPRVCSSGGSRRRSRRRCAPPAAAGGTSRSSRRPMPPTRSFARS